MNEHTMNIDDLISHYIDGELSGEAEAELHHRLSVSPDDRKRFREQIMLRGIARDGRVLERPTPAMRSALFARLEEEEGLKPLAAASAAYAAPIAGHADGIAADAATPVPTGVAPSGPARHRAADRPAIDRRERRRRLVPVLLPILLGVIMTAALWQFLGDDASDKGGSALTTATAPQTPDRAPSAGPYGGVPDNAVGGDIATANPADPESTALAAAPDEALSSPDGEQYQESRPGGMTDGGTRGAVGSSIATAEPESRPATDDRVGNGPVSDELTLRERAPDADASRREMAIADMPAEERGNGSGGLMSDGGYESARAKARRDDDVKAASEKESLPRRAAAPVQTSVSAFGGVVAKPELSQPAAPINGVAAAPALEESIAMGPQVQQADTTEGLRITAHRNVDRDASFLSTSIEPKTVFSAGLRQSLMVTTSERDLSPALALRVGAELDDGRHEVFGVLGYTTYRQQQVVATNTYEGAPGSATERLVSTMSSSNSMFESEFFGGAGYRFNIVRGERWRAGAGTSVGYGERFARIGAELPVAYQISKNVRIELTPSIEYANAHGPTLIETNTTSFDQASAQRSLRNEQSQISESEIRAGVGVGVTVVME
jgi:hypothetical protein